MPFDEMIVNISATTESGRQTSRFLKLDLALVYDRTQDTEGLVEMRHIYLRDAFQVIFGNWPSATSKGRLASSPSRRNCCDVRGRSPEAMHRTSCWYRGW